METKLIYYTDELNVEFSTAQIKPRKIDGSYPYVKNSPAEKAAHFLLYDVLARPIGRLMMKIIYHHKIVNRKAIKEVGKRGYFLYGNHTNVGADPFVPSYVTYPACPYVIVHPNNISMPVAGKLVEHLGALPLPDDKDAMKHFREAIHYRIKNGSPVVIYPEAHIWPYYTDIRPFKDTSFHYPVDLQAPVFCFTNTYQKKRFGIGVKMVTYVDGPFYPVPVNADGSKNSPKAQRKELRDRVYGVMKERAKQNTVTLVTYIKKEDHD